MPMDMPPMDMQPEMGNDMGGNFMPQGQDMMQQPPMDGGMGGEMPNQFDTNFDAGVEADEEQDPKKYIQQLTGKLSQTLQKYTDDNGQADVDLNKYVAGMITKQAMKGLSEEDAEEILDKVKAGEDFSIEGDEQQDVQMGGDVQQPQGQDMMQQPPQGQDMQQPPMAESYGRFKKKGHIKEITNNILNNIKNGEEKPKQEKDPKNNTYRTSPFTFKRR